MSSGLQTERSYVNQQHNFIGAATPQRNSTFMNNKGSFANLNSVSNYIPTYEGQSARNYGKESGSVNSSKKMGSKQANLKMVVNNKF